MVPVELVVGGVQEDEGAAALAAHPMTIRVEGSHEEDGFGGSGQLEQIYHYRLEDVFNKEDMYWKDDVGLGSLLSTLDAEFFIGHRFVTDLHQMVDSAPEGKPGYYGRGPRRN